MLFRSEEHKSVIMHLLSQVRLGMDLTKVTHTSLSHTHTHTHTVSVECWRSWCGCVCVVSLQVVLPTFILERRSLLEMYADFFAHPDLFVR